VTSELVWRGAGRTVPVELKPNARARRVTLRVDAVLRVIRLSLHPRMSPRRALAMLETHHEWIAARVAAWPEPIRFAPGAIIPIEGREVTVDWSAGHARTPVLDGDRLLAGGPLDALEGRIERFLRSRAKLVLEAETRTLAERLEKRVATVSVRDTSSRWGSCTAGGRIAYSWRLILAPPDVRRYVVAHEVAHLAHMNHGSDFWRLTEELYGGDIATARRWLKRHGPSLHGVGRRA